MRGNPEFRSFSVGCDKLFYTKINSHNHTAGVAPAMHHRLSRIPTYRVAQKKRGHRPSYLIANIPKTLWPNCMEIGGLLQYYMLNTVINFLFKNFIALWRHLAKTQLLSFYSHCINRFEHHTVAGFSLAGATEVHQFPLNSVMEFPEYLQRDRLAPFFCAILYKLHGLKSEME